MASAVVHAAILAVAAWSMPHVDATPARLAPGEGEYQLLPAFFLLTAAVEEEPPADVVRSAGDDRELSESRCGERRGGSMGDTSATSEGNRYGVEGPVDNPDPHLAQHAYPHGSSSIMFSMPPHAGSWGGDTAAPLAPWGREDSLGTDPESARGPMWGGDIATNRGARGLSAGRRRICETCGDDGRGLRRRSGPGSGPPQPMSAGVACSDGVMRSGVLAANAAN